MQSATDISAEVNSRSQGQVVDLIVSRIAQSIGVPVATLMGEASASTHGLAAPAMIELRTLLTTFLLLDHPAARRRCIALAEAELARQNRRDEVGATV